MWEDDSAYAVAFAVPANTDIITLSCSEPEVHETNNLFIHPIFESAYINEATIIFHGVFVPNERRLEKWKTFHGGLIHKRS